MKTILLLTTMAVALMVASSVALAGVFEGDQHNNRLVGTKDRDTLRGFDGADVIRALDGRDRLFGGTGDDTMYGGPGDDLIWGGGGVDHIRAGAGDDYVDSVGDDGRDFVDCGPGLDRIERLPLDTGPRDVYRNCELSPR